MVVSKQEKAKMTSQKNTGIVLQVESLVQPAADPMIQTKTQDTFSASAC